MKNLSNDQRSRLEQITHDEFQIRAREIQATKKKEHDDWLQKEKEKIMKSPEVKKLKNLYSEADKIKNKLRDKGITICTDQGNAVSIGLNNSRGMTNYVGRQPGQLGIYKNYPEMLERTKVDHDAITRGRNEVLAVIWSMEKSFDACVKLIKEKVNKIK